MFFDEHPRFYETSETAAHRGRLNLRYEAIFAENREVFEGARVLDIASHDGRWSLAALKTGAAEVVGIEAREELVQAANENLQWYAGTRPYRFVTGDVFDVLARERFGADVVVCLGFLYHTLRYNELLTRIREMNPRHLVIDTTVLPRRQAPVVRLVREPTERQKNAVADSYSFRGTALVGWPSVPALELIVAAFGFAVERYSDWGSILRDNPELWDVIDDYAEGRRVTALCASSPD
jgi:cyclopropane fatty-acyl-phospholipid synthase-like methyltransferase